VKEQILSQISQRWHNRGMSLQHLPLVILTLWGQELVPHSEPTPPPSPIWIFQWMEALQ